MAQLRKHHASLNLHSDCLRVLPMSISPFFSLSELINFRRVTEIFVNAMSIARQFADDGDLRIFEK